MDGEQFVLQACSGTTADYVKFERQEILDVNNWILL